MSVEMAVPAARKSLPDSLLGVYYEHRLFFIVLVVYVFFGYMVLAFIERNGFAHLFSRFMIFAFCAVIYLGFLLMLKGARQLARVVAEVIERRTGIARVRGKSLGPPLSSRQVAGYMVIMVSLTFFLSTFSNLKQAIPLIHPFSWDELFMKMDYYLHGWMHPWALLHPILGIPVVTKLIDSLYVSWFGFLFFFLTGFGLNSRRRLRSRYCISFILTWIITGSIMAILLSSAGPCYYGKINPGANPFLPLMEYLRSVHDDRFLFAVKFQDGLWLANTANKNLIFGGVSAMPSVHVATAALFACAAWSIHRLLGYFFIIYAVLVQIGSVHLGWHYAIDGYIGTLIAVAIWRVSDRIYPPET
jgi:hypothetical protein